MFLFFFYSLRLKLFLSCSYFWPVFSFFVFSKLEISHRDVFSLSKIHFQEFFRICMNRQPSQVRFWNFLWIISDFQGLKYEKFQNKCIVKIKKYEVYVFSLSIVLILFLFFGHIQPHCSYKIVLIKKKCMIFFTDKGVIKICNLARFSFKKFWILYEYLSKSRTFLPKKFL